MLEKNIQVVVDSRDWENPDRHRSLIDFYSIRRFADELESACATHVPVTYDLPNEQGHSKMIFLFAAPDIYISLNSIRETYPGWLNKIMAVSVNKTNIFEIVQEFKLAGAIEIHDYFLWKKNIQEGYPRIHGLTAVCNKIGGVELITEGDYSWFNVPPVNNLISLVCKYIDGIESYKI